MWFATHVYLWKSVKKPKFHFNYLWPPSLQYLKIRLGVLNSLYYDSRVRGSTWKLWNSSHFTSLRSQDSPGSLSSAFLSAWKLLSTCNLEHDYEQQITALWIWVSWFAFKCITVNKNYLFRLLVKTKYLSSVELLGRVGLFVTPWTAARQVSLSITNSRRLFKFMSIKSVMPSNHFILCWPLLLPHSILLSITVFSNESLLSIRQPKYWSFSFNISPSIEHSGLIFRMDWLDLLAA